MARRKTRVLRKLDDPVRLAGVLTVRSAGLLGVFGGVLLYAELTLSVFSALAGPVLAPAVILAVIGLAGAGLLAVERHEDEHYVPALIRYYVSGRWRGVWSAGVVARRRPPARPLSVLVEEWSWR